MNKKTLIIIVVLAIIALSAGIFIVKLTQPKVPPISEEPFIPEEPPSGKIKLTYAIHWMDETQIEGIYEGGKLKEKGLKRYLEKYTKLHPEIEFEIMQIEYGDYADKLKMLHELGIVPDIYQIYSTWGVSYVDLDMLDKPPQDIKDDIVENYVSTAGVTINGEIWGIPTEINDFSLLYNKAIFKEAGLVDEKGDAKPPKTWKELIEAAIKTTKKDAAGNIIQYGFAFIKGMDWAVVDPFLCLLFSNNGKYLADDYSQALFNSPGGVEALEAVLELFDKGATDINSNVWDFGKSKVAMVFTAPWVEGILKDAMGDKFDTDVGVAPIPYLKEPATLQYSWFMGVMNKSEHKEEAWDFLRWFTSEIQPDRNTTRYGDLMARTIKAIPSRKIDMENNKDVLDDNFFKGPFVAQLKDSVPEPNILEAARVKEILRREIEAAWIGKSVKKALDDAAAEVNKILEKYYPKIR